MFSVSVEPSPSARRSFSAAAQEDSDGSQGQIDFKCIHFRSFPFDGYAAEGSLPAGA